MVQVWIDDWLGVVGTVTPAFKEYAMALLLSHGNLFNQALNLNLPMPLTTNHVTEIRGSPRVDGLSGGIVTLDRYAIFISGTRVEKFTDLHFADGPSGPDFFKRLAQVTNSFPTNTAIEIARGALLRLNIAESSLEKKQPEVRTQSDVDGKPLPYFFLNFGNVRMEVSGVTSNVVEIFNMSPGLRVFPPTNYFEIVGATNEVLRTPQATIRKRTPRPPRPERPKHN